MKLIEYKITVTAPKEYTDSKAETWLRDIEPQFRAQLLAASKHFTGKGFVQVTIEESDA